MTTVPGEIMKRFTRVDSFSGNFHDASHLEERNCPVCGDSRALPVIGFNDFQFFSDDPARGKRTRIRQVRCGCCFALYMNPRYSSSGFRTLFAEAGLTYGSSALRQEEQITWLRNRDLLAPGSLLLDVGCYSGALIAALPNEVAAVGVDIDEDVIREANTAFAGSNRRFIAGDFERFEYDGRVDVITMFHVLEHLPRPRAVLEKLRRLAHKRTRLVVEVPVLEKGKTNDINGYLTVAHLTHFSIRTLEMCLAETGWRIEAREEQAYNGYRVVALPAEPTGNSRANPADLACLQDYLSDWYANQARVTLLLQKKVSGNFCVIRGAGLHTELIYQLTHFFQTAPERKFLIVDSHARKQGKSWRGIAIEPPSVLARIGWDETDLLISSYGNQQEMADQAREIGVPDSRIIRIYDFIRRY